MHKEKKCYPHPEKANLVKHAVTARAKEAPSFLHLYAEVARQALDTALEGKHRVSSQRVRVFLYFVRQADLHSVRQMVDLDKHDVYERTEMSLHR